MCFDITLTALKDETKIKDNQRLTIDEILLRKYIPPRHSLFWISGKGRNQIYGVERTVLKMLFTWNLNI